MFIYLDHAHFSALDVLLRQKPAEFAEFLEFWLAHGCQLVVSRAHLHEIGQSADDRDVQKRLEVLRYFSVWSGAEDENVDWVIIYEILNQTLHRLDTDAEPGRRSYLPLREMLYHPVAASTIEQFVWAVRPGLLDDQRSRQEFARFENTGINLRKTYERLTNRKAVKWDRDGWKLLPLVRSTAPKAGGDLVADKWMAEVEARTPECWRRAYKKREMLTCVYDIRDLACIKRAPEQDLSRIGFYRALGRHWVPPYCERAGHDPGAVQAALDLLDPYDAPAISAALAVERGRKLHDKEYEASDFMDVDHVLWAAYTDLAFVDKRTHGFLLQAKKNPVTARLLSPHLAVRFERAANLDDVKQHITRIATERPQSFSEP
jgi:hypothetical protein